MMMVFSPSQDELSAMTLAWRVTSWGESWGNSLGWVWIQPRGSMSWEGMEGKKERGREPESQQLLAMRLHNCSQTFRYSCCGSMLWRWTVCNKDTTSHNIMVIIFYHHLVLCFQSLSPGGFPTEVLWPHNVFPSPEDYLEGLPHTDSQQSERL